MCPASCVVCPASCVVCRVPCVVCRVSCVVCRVSCVVCRVSCVVCRVPCAVCRRAPRRPGRHGARSSRSPRRSVRNCSPGRSPGQFATIRGSPAGMGLRSEGVPLCLLNCQGSFRRALMPGVWDGWRGDLLADLGVGQVAGVSPSVPALSGAGGQPFVTVGGHARGWCPAGECTRRPIRQ
ncbi:hypothetical protein F1C58_13375 [Glaciihabitans sp. INWT7]|nr:hypothetical protein F1C58_13375 [Glaciihabitans sp. INWT7]